MTLADYRACLAIARRYARNTSDAADLLQEGLLAGIQAGRLDFTAAADRAWLAGTVRNISAETARGESRRRLRDTRWAAEQPTEMAAVSPDDSREAILERLSDGTIAGTWFDSRGVSFPLEGTVEPEGAMTILWGMAETERGRSSYRISDAGLEVTDEVMGPEGAWRTFGRTTLTRLP